MIEGVWPDAAATAPEADVVVCHHVAYNAPFLDTFARALTEHARRRVVMELTASHPLSTMNDLWVRFHGLARPDRPTADDAQAVLREAGLEPEREDWVADGGGGFARREDLVAFVRLRLCPPRLARRGDRPGDRAGGAAARRALRLRRAKGRDALVAGLRGAARDVVADDELARAPRRARQEHAPVREARESFHEPRQARRLLQHEHVDRHARASPAAWPPRASAGSSREPAAREEGLIRPPGAPSARRRSP